MRLRIRYRSSEDAVSDREISELVVEPPNAVNAFCHARNGVRTFVLDRIEEAIDAGTGEVIADIWLYLGLPSRKPLQLEMPVFSGRKHQLSAEELRNLRKADKNALFRQFKYEVIAAAKKRQLWALFDSRCFSCASTGFLELDHHIPQDLGGRLVPGNIVLLCRDCNSRKRTAHPERFYSPRQLESLQPLLEAQLRLFEFQFNWTRWTHHPEEYLTSLGATEEEARSAVREPDHPLYVGYDPSQ
jgi:5-methylcytosine-specific restriction endonuclease McrA